MRHHSAASELVLWQDLMVMPPLSRAARVWLPHHRTRPRSGLRAGGGSGLVARLGVSRERWLGRAGCTVVRLSGECVVREPLFAVGAIVHALKRLR